MLKFLDDIPNYKADEEATAPTNERLSQFYAFLEKPDYTKFFVWIEFENPELRWSFERAPYYYEAGKLVIKFKSGIWRVRHTLTLTLPLFEFHDEPID